MDSIVIIKPCPSCQSQTSKTRGCNRIKCPICGVQWCYVCGKVSGTNTKKIRKLFTNNQCVNENHVSQNFQ